MESVIKLTKLFMEEKLGFLTVMELIDVVCTLAGNILLWEGTLIGPSKIRQYNGVGE